MFYSILFRIHLNNKVLRYIIILLIPFYLILFILNVIFIQGLTTSFHSYTFLLGSFFMVVYSCFFLYESILPESINVRLSRQPFFWITIGLLIFYSFRFFFGFYGIAVVILTWLGQSMYLWQHNFPPFRIGIWLALGSMSGLYIGGIMVFNIF